MTSCSWTEDEEDAGQDAFCPVPSTVFSLIEADLDKQPLSNRNSIYTNEIGI